MKFHKYHGLGNDYLVLDLDEHIDPRGPLVRRLCDRHYGIGSDGVLIGARTAATPRFRLRIFNPDGSEAEKSGNGLRIFARYLWDAGLVGTDEFEVATAGGTVTCRVDDDGRGVVVAMGRASFDSEQIPVAGPRREVVDELVTVGGEELRYTAVTVGNPHCVVPVESASPALAQRLGPLLERHPLFPNRTNVQFLQVVEREQIKIEIWERGAGYTLASGSSSCAAAAAAVRLGLCSGQVAVIMPGGTLSIEVGAGYDLTMAGPVAKIAQGTVADELLEGVV